MIVFSSYGVATASRHQFANSVSTGKTNKYPKRERKQVKIIPSSQLLANLPVPSLYHQFPKGDLFSVRRSAGSRASMVTAISASGDAL